MIICRTLATYKGRRGTTTALYTRIAVNTVHDIKSPPERLGVNLASRSPPA
jgi:hypothetical protein